MDTSFGALIFSSTVLSVTATLYCLAVLIRNKRKLGLKALLASIAFQIIFWDFLRCLTIGLVSGLYYLHNTEIGDLCSVIGPLTNMSHRLPFFLVLGHVISSLKRAEGSALWRWAGVGTVIAGYLTSMVFAVLPFLRGNTYILGYDGFCTYYSDAVIGYDFYDEENVSPQDILRYDILLSVLPFALVFVVVVLGWVSALCSKSNDATSLVNTGSLLFCYLPMFGMGMTLVAQYFGVNTFLASYEPDPTTVWAQMMSMIVLPVSTPLINLFINAILFCCKTQAERREMRQINRKCSMSTTILVHNVDGILDQ